MQDVGPQLAALLQFVDELNARLAAAGIDGVSGALELQRRLQGVLDAIPGAELERMIDGVGALRRRMEELAAALAVMRDLKTGYDAT